MTVCSPLGCCNTRRETGTRGHEHWKLSMNVKVFVAARIEEREVYSREGERSRSTRKIFFRAEEGTREREGSIVPFGENARSQKRSGRCWTFQGKCRRGSKNARIRPSIRYLTRRAGIIGKRSARCPELEQARSSEFILKRAIKLLSTTP